MRRRWFWVAALVVGLFAGGALRAGPAAADFIQQSVDNDFATEIKEVAADGKFLVIMFHQRGCPYCDKMRERVFPAAIVDDYYSKHFVLIESNIRGDVEVVAPDGTAMREKAFGKLNRVRATPVFVFFDQQGKVALRLTGYSAPERFRKAGEYVVSGTYKTETSFYRYLQTN